MNKIIFISNSLSIQFASQIFRKPAMVNESQKTNLDLNSQRSQVSNPSKTELGTLNKNSRRSGLRFNPERTLTHVQIRMNKDSSRSATMLSEETDDHPTFEHTNARDMSAEEIVSVQYTC